MDRLELVVDEGLGGMYERNECALSSGDVSLRGVVSAVLFPLVFGEVSGVNIDTGGSARLRNGSKALPGCCESTRTP